MRRFLPTVILLCGLISAPAAAAEPAPARTYSNPVTAGVVDTFPDPTTIRGKDGYWYAYGTQNPVFQSRGEDGERMLPILRSADLVTWQYAGEVFTPRTQPAWHNGSRLWAPDIRYVNGRYHVYYSVPGRNTVGLATAPTPTGPWTDVGAVLPTPSGCPTGNIDQALFTDTDGVRYFYWGSYDTICVARMNAGATRVEGAVTQVARGRRMEGAFTVKRGGFYYLFYSDAGCCEGAYSGYQVKVGRSAHPTGPFTDDENVDLMALTSKGAIVAGANGNRWIGPGHNGIQTDLAGQDWLVYHGIPSDDPDLRPASGGTLKLTRRPMLIDRLDWIGGWPVLRGGAGPSEGPQPAPVTTAPANRAVPADFRAEVDLKVVSDNGAAGLRYGRVQVLLDRARHALVSVVGRDRRMTPLPADFAFDVWQHVTVTVHAGRMAVSVGDMVDVQERAVPRGSGGRVDVTTRDASADNLTAVPLYKPVTARVAEPAAGELLPAFSDEFNGTAPGSAWRWVRGPAAGVTMTGSALSWPTQNAELADGNNTAAVLLRDAPRGDYVVETKIRFSPGLPAQQAGILLYENDDRYFKLVHSVLPLNRGGGAVLQMSEFDKEGERPTTTPPTPLYRAPMFGGPTADTMWLRLTHHHDPANGETEIRASTSRDGARWVAMGVWTLPTRDALRIGLVSMNRAGALAEFDYVRTYRN